MWVRRIGTLCVVAAGFGGCDLVKASGIQTDYSFDAIEYASPNWSAAGGTVPDVACSDANDPCAALTTAVNDASVVASCDTSMMKCVGTLVIRVSDTINLSQQTESTFPSAAIQYGVDSVEVKRFTYWINQNQLDVELPPIDFYVAPTAARDETDPAATLLTSTAMIGAMSTTCGDPAYPDGDTKANGAAVCSAPLPQAGKSALASFVKSYSTPFQIIAHTQIVIDPGAQVPTGSISFAARPTVGLKILN